MSVYKTFGTDRNIEKTGVWLEYGKNSKDQPIRIRIARAGGANDAYNKRIEAKTRPVRRQIQTETLPPDQLKEIVMQVFAETVVLSWENMEDADGNDLAFTRENVIKVFTDLPDLFLDVQEQANRTVLFRKDIQEVASGN